MSIAEKQSDFTTYAEPPAAKPINWILEGIISTDEEEIVLLHGEKGTRKSFVVDSLAVALASEPTDNSQFTEWMGRRCRNGHGVLIMGPEAGPDTRNRLIAAAHAQGLNGVVPPLIAVRTGPFNLLGDGHNEHDLMRDMKWIPGDVGKLIRQIDGAYGQEDRMPFSADIVFWDGLSRFLSGADENSPAVMGKVVERLDYIARTTKTKQIIVHHEVNGTARGAKQLREAAATVIRVQSVGPALVRGTRLTVCYQRSGPAGMVLDLVAHEMTLGTEPDTDKPITSLYLMPDDGSDAPPKAKGGTSRTIKSPKVNANYEAAYAALKSFPDGATNAEWRAKANLSPSTFDRAVKVLIKEVRVVHKPDIDRYWPTV